MPLLSTPIRRSITGLWHICGCTGRSAEAGPVLLRALDLDPSDPATLVALGELDLSRGEQAGARARAQEALEQAPEHLEALVLMGEVLLRQGDIEGARDHALWAVHQDASDAGALRLLASIKARTNRFLGLWWRWNAWMSTTSDGSEMLWVLAPYVLYRVASTAATNAGWTSCVQVLSYVWLALVAYTWYAPVLYRRMLAKELGDVRLRSGF